ncbi:MAG TPA: VOC family protein [Streptosporangiaceae bacterium]|jgi:predicted enzyme related to lactoylglutathione lyase
MATRLVHLAHDAQDPARLARFWSAALGWRIALEKAGVVAICPHGYAYPEPGAVPLVFVAVPGAKAGQNRVHLHLATSSAAHQQELTEHLIGLGASRADIGQGGGPWVVLTDPEGTHFCVLTPC